MSTIQQLFSELERHVKREEHEKVLSISDKILALDPKDKDALHCKAITLIRLERYTDVLSLLNRQLQGQFVFEKAYCLYRTNQLADGALLIENRRRELLSQGEPLPWDLRHLEAQILYRMEKYQECIVLYADMLQDTDKSDEGYNDILTNFNACKAAVLYSGESLEDKWKIRDVTKTTYELSFNSACARIATGDYTQALTLLEEAKQLCREALSDYDEEEVEQELAIIVVQTAYVYQLLGRLDKARDLYNSVLKIKALEVTVPAVAANNLVAIQKEEDLFDSSKKIKTATTKALGVKFFSSQKRTIAMNELLLNLYQNKFAACRDSTRQLLKSQPDNDALYLILAATMHKQKKTAKALEDLLEFAQTRPESIAIEFAIIQLRLLDGQDYTAAIESLTRFLKGLPKKEQHRPGFVALLVWLYGQAGQGEKGAELLTEASAQWAKDNNESTMPLALLRQTAAFKLRSHRYKDAAKDYEELVRADPSDPASIAGLIMAYSEFEPALAEKYGASLPEMRKDLMTALDVESLEKVVPGLKREYVSVENTTGTRTGGAVGSSASVRGPGSRPRRSGARKPTKRKPILPIGMDPAAYPGSPDPERWMSKRDRAAARLARARKTGGGSKKDMGKGAQGMTLEGGGVGGTGSARIAGRELPAAPVRETPVVVEEVVDVAAIAKAKSTSSSKKKKGKGKGKW